MKKSSSLMKQLINTYAITLLIVITIFAVSVSYVTSKQDSDQVQYQMNQLSTSIPIAMDDYYSNFRRMVFDLFKDQDDVKSMLDYMFLDYASYFEKQMEQPVPQFFTKDVQNLYDRYDGIEGILVTLNDTNDIYYSNKSNKMGSKVARMPNVSGKLIIDRTIPNFQGSKSEGMIYLIVDYDNVEKVIESIPFQVETSVFIESGTGKLKYAYNNGQGDALANEMNKRYEGSSIAPLNSSQYLLKSTNLIDGSTLHVAVARSSIFMASFQTYSWVVFTSLILDILLLFILFKTFGRYDTQLNNILGGMQMVQEGDIDFRISTEDKEKELYTMTTGINMTLDSISEYIDQIYKLEISQQEVNLRALQSQINPHFLYNTLEFIRMYAVSEGVDELAEIVFTFSTLLRNNISLDKTTTLRKELEFCEKYVYLHQMRYPNRIAYKFDIDEGLDLITIPKFTLQPLIENYFVHGVDYGSVQNAISVSASNTDGRISIRVSDNGQGMNDERMAELQGKIDHSVFDISTSNSIGILNVHQRLKMYLKDYNYQMILEHNKPNGFAVVISFDQEENDDQSNISR